MPIDNTFRDGKRLAGLSLGLNITLMVAKFALYLYTGSTALLAETLHSFTDVIGSIFIIGGIHLSGMKSRQFPWGLYKVENLAAVLSSGLIFLSAYEMGGMISHPSPQVMRNLDIALIVLVFMALPIVLFSSYEIKRAKAINSPSLIADAEHWRADIAPLAVVAGFMVFLCIYGQDSRPIDPGHCRKGWIRNTERFHEEPP